MSTSLHNIKTEMSQLQLIRKKFVCKIRLLKSEKEGAIVLWNLFGLQMGDVETIPGDPRVTRIDFYIGMDDLFEQRNTFFTTTGTSYGNVNGLRIPVGHERSGGTQIRWSGAIGRLEISDVQATRPPYKLNRNVSNPVILNIDRETSPYPITSNNGGRTIRELHFGIEHNYIVNRNRIVKIPRISFKMTENDYATILSFIDWAIAVHQNNP